MQVKWKRQVFNDAYFPYLNCQTRKQIFFGGSSSGKSYFVLGQRVIYDILNGGRNFLICRNTAKTNRISTFNEVSKAILRSPGLITLFQINKSEMTITCVNGYQIYFAGLDDPEKLKSITPAKGVITDIIYEEATEISYDSVKTIRKRLRGKTKDNIKKRETFIFNPIIKSHWIYKEFFEGKFQDEDKCYHDDDLLILKTTYLDNLKHLEEDDIYELENENDPYYRDVYTFGNWGVLGDIIFKKDIHWRVEDLEQIRENYNNYLNGLDFGFSNDPTALLRCTIHNNDIYVFDTHGGKAWDNFRIAQEIEPIVGNEYVWCDSAEPKSIHELKGYGIRALPVQKGKDYLLHAIQWIQRHNLIVDKRCQELINELSLFQWKKDKDGNAINQPIDKNNHWIDALHYALSTEIRKIAIKPGKVITRKYNRTSKVLVGY